MKMSGIAQIGAAAALLAIVTGSAGAQQGAVIVNRGYYGGYYGGADPTFTVTPFGIQTLGYGYNGYTGTGTQDPFDWGELRPDYELGDQNARSATAGNDNDGEVSYAAGMTATPRGMVGRVPHGSDGVRMQRIGKGQVLLRWQGDPRIARSITFTLADRSGKALRRTTVTQLPAEARFTTPANAAYYQATVHYVDGATNTIMSKLSK